MKTIGKNQGSTYSCHHIIQWKHSYFYIFKIKRAKFYSENRFVKFCCPVKIRSSDFEPADCIVHVVWFMLFNLVTIHIKQPTFFFAFFAVFIFSAKGTKSSLSTQRI